MVHLGGSLEQFPRRHQVSGQHDQSGREVQELHVHHCLHHSKGEASLNFCRSVEEVEEGETSTLRFQRSRGKSIQVEELLTILLI